MKLSSLASRIMQQINRTTMMDFVYYGATLHPVSGDNALEGYAVGTIGTELRIDIRRGREKVTLQVIEQWLKTVWFRRAAKPDQSGGYREHTSGGGYADLVMSTSRIGWWVKDGFLYLDHVIVMSSLEDARIVATTEQQQAIYSLHENREITIAQGWDKIET